jgi:hypothetical protein
MLRSATPRGTGTSIQQFRLATASLPVQRLALGLVTACHETSSLASPGRLRRYLAAIPVQGTRFDPWVRFGVGVAGLHLAGSGKDFDYLGLSWANLMFGGDWYASKSIGFGPVLSCALQSYLHVPADRSASVAERLTIGMRVTFDVNGR